MWQMLSLIRELILNIQTNRPPRKGMASNHSATQGVDMTLWNEAQGRLKEELAEVGEPTLEAFLVSSFTYVDGTFNVSVKGGARRNIGEGHAAHPILSKTGVGSGNSIAQALRAALESR